MELTLLQIKMAYSILGPVLSTSRILTCLTHMSFKSRHLSSLFVKLRHWEIKQLAQGYTTSKWQLVLFCFLTRGLLVHLKL